MSSKRLPRPEVVDVKGAARLLDLTVAGFRSARPALEAAGFPKPLPGLHKGRWERDAIKLWMKRNRPPALQLDEPGVGATVAHRFALPTGERT